MENSTDDTRSIRVAIVGANPIVGVGLKQVFRNEADIAVAGETSDAHGMQQVFDGAGIDVVLVDALSMAEPAAGRLRSAVAAQMDVALLVMTTRASVHTHVRLFRSGASGYVAKESPPSVLVDAVRHVADRRRFIDAALAEAMFFASALCGSDPREMLSRREFEVLQQLAQGHSLSDISRTLNLSIKTVSTHKTRLMQKLQLKSSADMIRFAIKRGLD
ncbi:response regulator transcription factor [Paraburkholderia kururiensis]|uniref:response regulator transcription factor n=1 Tax=Paraburkholderia kururiensis TaxID=984307 RepID=UPI0018F40DA6|nr:response regulator transcription factor [Paraburkholderia kururiensis]